MEKCLNETSILGKGILKQFCIELRTGRDSKERTTNIRTKFRSPHCILRSQFSSNKRLHFWNEEGVGMTETMNKIYLN